MNKFDLIKWQNKIAVVTGASSGIGAAISKALVEAGLVVIGLARRVELIEQLRVDLPAEKRTQLHAHKCDVSDTAAINATFDAIIERFGGVDVLVNNAGFHHSGSLMDMQFDLLQSIMQTNFNAAVFCTIRAFNSMRTRNAPGHVFMINSITGHRVPINMTPGQMPVVNLYPSSKFALRVVTEIFRQEFIASNAQVKITSLSPGFVDTALVSPDIAAIIGDRMLQPMDIAQNLLYVLSTPPNVNVHEMMIKPRGELM